MEGLTFQEKDHKYFLDGKEIPSVSELTRFISREIYGEADPIALQRAAEKGTAVHDALQQLDETGTVEVPEEYSGYIQAYMKFREEHNVEWEKVEWMLTDGVFAGRIDRYGLVDGVPCILDFKTTARITKEHELLYSVALTLYFKLVRFNEKIADKLYVLQLKQDGTYKLIDLRFAIELANSCILMHYAFIDAKQKKVKYPCRKCVYFDACGDKMRTEPCKGRRTAQ